MSDRRFVALTALVGAVFVAFVYLPDVGRGFVKDDFRWLGDARLALAEPALAVFPRAPNFYRPVVTASFAADDVLFGLRARGYGFTNLALYACCGLAIFWLLRAVGIGAAPSAVGVLAWALNPHGINMAVVWLSGRTSLLLTLFGVLSMLSFLRGRRWTGSVLLLAALLSKEEAVVLPLVLAVWLFAFRRADWKTALAPALDAVCVVLPVVAYFVVRARTPALTPSTAPWFYRLTADPRVVGLNALAYLDRGATFFAVIVLVAVFAYGFASSRIARAQLRSRQFAAGMAWFVGGFAVTVWLPVRSSLYAVFPSVGTALLCASALEALRGWSDQGVGDPRARPLKPAGAGQPAGGGQPIGGGQPAGAGAPNSRRARGDRRLGAALVAVLVFVPIYQRRNERWVEPARLSARIVETLTIEPPAPGATGVVVFEDEPGRYASFDTALGALASSAVQVVTNVPLEAQILQPGQAWTGATAARYRLTAGRVEKVE